jgi:hypothetical protein
MPKSVVMVQPAACARAALTTRKAWTVRRQQCSAISRAAHRRRCRLRRAMRARQRSPGQLRLTCRPATASVRPSMPSTRARTPARDTPRPLSAVAPCPQRGPARREVSLHARLPGLLRRRARALLVFFLRPVGLKVSLESQARQADTLSKSLSMVSCENCTSRPSSSSTPCQSSTTSARKPSTLRSVSDRAACSAAVPMRRAVSRNSKLSAAPDSEVMVPRTENLVFSATVMRIVMLCPMIAARWG